MYIFHVSLIIYFLINIYHTTEAYFSPGERTAHTATLYDNKIYFLGGSSADGTLLTNDFFYLDLKINFNTNDPKSIPYFDLSDLSSNHLPRHRGGSTSICGANKDTIFLWGGDIESDPLINTFKFDGQPWTSPNQIDGIRPVKRRRLQSVCDDKGLMYLYGGSVDEDMGPLQVFNNTDLLDTVNLAWETMGKINAPGPNNFYSATLLPSGYIVYIGGWSGLTVTDNDFILLDTVTLYNVNTNIWSTMTTVGNIPSKRDAIAAVLTKDGRLIISGGEFPHLKPADRPISVLDTSVNPFEWSAPKIFTPNPFPFLEHTATLYDDRYMIIAFGMIYDGSTARKSSNLYILDVSDRNNYQWVTQYTSKFPQPDPAINSTITSPPTAPSGKLNNLNIGVIIGSIVLGLIFFGVISFFTYKWYQKRQEFKNAIPTSGDSNFTEFK